MSESPADGSVRGGEGEAPGGGGDRERARHIEVSSQGLLSMDKLLFLHCSSTWEGGVRSVAHHIFLPNEWNGDWKNIGPEGRFHRLSWTIS
ncbi:hypothetical protein DFH06DRAFT_1324470 [Mycena polygramma]|nr:hypothetical protein DFH06DRAFT_1324470 [Mycena polygramma]